MAILTAHAVVIHLLRDSLQVHRRSAKSTVFVAQIIEVSRPTLLLDIPRPVVPRVDLRLAMPAMAQTEIDEVSGAGTTSHFEPARLDSSRPIAKFVVAESGNHHAPSTITLLVGVLADGSVGQVEIKASAGSALDAAAESYVRRLHWTPANIGGKPIAMKVLYSVGLS